MGTRRLGLLLLGLWLGISFSMLFVATQNFRGVDRLLSAPSGPAARTLDYLETDEARALMRHQASELNRFYFDWYGTAQIVLGVVFAINMLWGSSGRKLPIVLCVTALAIVVIEKLLLTPEITVIGRALDFEIGPAVAMRERFWRLHFIFTGLEMIKLSLLAALSIRGLLRRRSRHSSQHVEAREEHAPSVS